jgi:hypothetical protein
MLALASFTSFEITVHAIGERFGHNTTAVRFLILEVMILHLALE